MDCPLKNYATEHVNGDLHVFDGRLPTKDEILINCCLHESDLKTDYFQILISKNQTCATLCVQVNPVTVFSNFNFVSFRKTTILEQASCSEMNDPSDFVLTKISNTKFGGRLVLGDVSHQKVGEMEIGKEQVCMRFI